MVIFYGVGAASSRDSKKTTQKHPKQMKPQKGSQLLRKGRTSIKNQHYLLTTAVHKRKPVLNHPEAAQIILSSLHWLESQKRIMLDAAVIMPDHLHFAGALRQDSLIRLMHSLKSYTAKKINALLNRQGTFWQPQYHDHALRKDQDLNEVVLYTLNNPLRAKLVDDFHKYPYWYCRWSV
jgi:REP element-mobilizing transposase RayT